LFFKQKRVRKFTWLDPWPVTIIAYSHSLIGHNACNGNVKLYVRGTCFFLLHLLSNNIKLHTSIQTKLNPIENCTRIFFTRLSENKRFPNHRWYSDATWGKMDEWSPFTSYMSSENHIDVV
jgi:hypothetical protein